MGTNEKGKINMDRFKFSKPFYLVVAGIVSVAIIASYFIFAAAPGQTPPGEIPAIAGEYVPDHVLVRFKAGTGKEKVAELIQKNGLEQKGEIPQIETKILKIKDKGNVAAKIWALSKNPHVLYAEPDYIVKTDLVPNDPYYPKDQKRYLESIKAPEGWSIATGNNTTNLAILDTGIAPNHPDFSGRITKGYDFVNLDSDPTDDNGHGTMVAGTSLATGNNSVGIAGVDWAAKIMPVKVLASSGSGVHSTIAQGITWAADNGASVINMSFGGKTATTTMESACNYAFSKGVTLLASSGNYGEAKVLYPSGYDTVISVGAVGIDTNLRTSWSNYGEGLSVMAPGEYIYTTNMSGGYAPASGTSIASPIAAGLASLIKGINNGLTNTNIKEIIESTATDLGDPGFDIYYGFGRINIAAALQKASGGTVTPPPATDTTAPSVAVSSPTSGSTVAGVIDVSVAASDNIGVSKVELYVDGKVYASTTVSPYTFSLDTTKLTNASHTLSAKAYDAAGNVGTSANVSVTVNNVSSTPVDTTLPTVSITSPKDGSTVSKKVSISVAATDNVGVTRVEIYVNGKLLSTLTSSPYTTNWNVGGKNVPKGENIITAYAYDAAGNVATTSVKVFK